MNALIITGLPASGKGTQCSMIAEKYNLLHLNAGELLRNEADKNSYAGIQAEEYTSRGELAPDSLLKNIVNDAIRKMSGKNGICFDGFPRTKEQALILEELALKNNLNVKGAIHLDIDEDEIRKRVKERGREDDIDPDVVQKRIEEQRKELDPLLQFYKKKSMLYIVKAYGTKESVNEDVNKIILSNHLLDDK